MKRRLPVAGLMPCITRICHPPLVSCQRVPVPFSRLLVVFSNFLNLSRFLQSVVIEGYGEKNTSIFEVYF